MTSLHKLLISFLSLFRLQDDICGVCCCRCERNCSSQRKKLIVNIFIHCFATKWKRQYQHTTVYQWMNLLLQFFVYFFLVQMKKEKTISFLNLFFFFFFCFHMYFAFTIANEKKKITLLVMVNKKFNNLCFF